MPNTPAPGDSPSAEAMAHSHLAGEPCNALHCPVASHAASTGRGNPKSRYPHPEEFRLRDRIANLEYWNGEIARIAGKVINTLGGGDSLEDTAARVMEELATLTRRAEQAEGEAKGLRRDNNDMRESPCAIWVRCPSCHRLHNQGWVCPGDCSEEAIDAARAGATPPEPSP